MKTLLLSFFILLSVTSFSQKKDQMYVCHIEYLGFTNTLNDYNSSKKPKDQISQLYSLLFMSDNKYIWADYKSSNNHSGTYKLDNTTLVLNATDATRRVFKMQKVDSVMIVLRTPSSSFYFHQK